jgi:hypothetical protein
VTIEVLFFDGCRHHEPLVARIRALLNDLGCDVQVCCRRVASERAAVALEFLGSPTVRVDRRDVGAGAELRTDYALKCRLYRTTAGLVGQPPDSWIAAAIRGSRAALMQRDP